MNRDNTELLNVIRETRDYLAIPDNDFAWSRWADRDTALTEIDGIIHELENDHLPPRMSLDLLFAPTGTIQNVSISSGWGCEFLYLSARFDKALKQAYVEQFGGSDS